MSGGILDSVVAWADGAGAAGVFIVAVLDSVALALPNATDALIMYLTIRQPELWWYYAAIATAGAVVGSLPLYMLAKHGGESYLKMLSGRRTAAALAWYRRSAFAAIAVPAFVPPPMPLKIFVLMAGATGFAPWRVIAAITLGRGTRHAIETLLAMRYHNEAVLAMERYGATGALVVMGAMAAVGAGVYLWYDRRASS